MHKSFQLKLVSGRAIAGAIVGLAVFGATAVQAQNKQTSPVGQGWNEGTAINANQSEADQVRQQIIASVNDYFQSLDSLKGTFLQTNPNNKQIGGKFYVQRPGRMRFDYSRPSRLRIVADGKWLSIEDPDTNTFDRYQLKSTPFRMLLRKDVNLLRDAVVIDHAVGEDVVILTLADRARTSGGQIKLFFNKGPDFQLREWIITDAQGLDTRIQVADLVTGEKINPKLFKVAPIKFPEPAD